MNTAARNTVILTTTIAAVFTLAPWGDIRPKAKAKVVTKHDAWVIFHEEEAYIQVASNTVTITMNDYQPWNRVIVRSNDTVLLDWKQTKEAK